MANRKRNTAPEILLRNALSALGVRFEAHPEDLPGCPDLVVRRRRMAVFCDGDFWHGRDWTIRRRKLAAGWNAKYWVAKIERNRRRDKQVGRELRRAGWTVIRLWETDVRADAARAASKILTRLNKGVLGRRLPQ